MADNKLKIITIIGPTASGKSNLSIQIAKKFNGEIISADSRQVYYGMDIGTGKVTKKEQKIIRHHLIDIASPKKQFTASDFKKLGEAALTDIARRSKLPIIVGGTGFYIDILLGRMATAQVPPNKKLRAKLEKQSTEQLYSRLLSIDDERAQKIDRYNKRRLVRAIEVFLETKKSSVPDSKFIIPNSRLNILWLGINPGKEKLAKNIKNRLEKRLGQGMINEVKKLLKNGVSHKRFQKFGLEYRWISLYLQNKISYKEMEGNLLRDIIRYSKRQMTWFKRNKEIHWINPRAGGQKEAEKAVSTFLQRTIR